MLRHAYLLRSSWTRLAELIYWPLVQMLMWGFLQSYLNTQSGFAARASGTLIGAILLWDILIRGQLGLSVSFLEEMWSRNIANLFISPLRPGEFLIALMAMSFIRLVIGVVPVTLLIVIAVVVSIPRDLVDAARNLGADAVAVFLRIILPLALPGISAAAALVFIDSFGAFAVPSLLGPAYPQALPVTMTTEFLERAHWEVASAIGLIMAATTVAVMALYYRLLAGIDRTLAA